MPCWFIDLFRYNTPEDNLKICSILDNHGIRIHQTEALKVIVRVVVRDDKPGAENRVFAAAEEIRAFYGLDDVVVSSDRSVYRIKSVCLA
jgi:uncharacterized DUF497 family protein